MALQGPLLLLLTTVVCCVGVLHTNANKLPLVVLVSFVTFFRCFIGWEYRISVGDTQSNWGPIGAVGKGHGFTHCFWGSRTSTKETPLGWCQEWKLAIASVLFFFFSVEITTKKNRGSLLAYTVVQRMQIVICIVWFWRFPPWLCRCNMSFYQKICLEMGFLSYTPLTVPSTRASSLHQQQPGGT